jgi:DNA-binding Xre family transcriptional regulator
VQFGRITVDTLDRVCEVLDVQPGDLLDWVPARKARRALR